MSKHVLLISQYFYPETFKVNDIAQEWVKRGYKVTVLTGIPNYPEGKFYKGYNWFRKRRENWNGIDIVRIPIVSRGSSLLRLVMNYYSFVVSGFFWTRFTSLKPDLIFTFEVSPMTQALVGKWFSKRKNIPNYLYVQDLWPDILETVGGIHNKAILNYYQKMSDGIYKSCKKVFASSPSFVNDIKERVNEETKVLYWPQFAEDIYKPAKRKNNSIIPDDERFKIIFTGNIGKAQGLDVLVNISKMLDDSVCFVIVGGGRSKEQILKSAADNQSNFIFVDRQPPEKIPELLAACDVALISFAGNPFFEKTIPAKLQSYMACGMPIVALASGETKRIIEDAGCGVCCDYGDAESFCAAINDLKKCPLKEMGEKALYYSKKYFDKNQLMDYIESEILS